MPANDGPQNAADAARLTLNLTYVTDAGKLYKKFSEIWTCIFENCQRTDRHTDKLIAILRTPTGHEITKQQLAYYYYFH